MKRLSILLCLLVLGCKSNHKINAEKTEFRPDFTAGPPVLVYKTKADYSNLVPVVLSDDGKTIISYPDPSDLKGSADLPKPTPLHEGYWLDNRGITGKVAFLRLTYEEYAALSKTPSLEELQNMIVDSDPLTELCDCGNKNALHNAVPQLNKLIKDGKLRKVCKVLK